MGARGGFEELLRESRPRLAPPVRATPRRGSAPDQSDPALVKSRGTGGGSGDPERHGDATRRLDQRIAEQRISALRARPLVRESGEASLAGRSLLGAIYRRLCGVLSISRGCSAPPRGPAQTARQVRPYARTDQDQAGRIWPVRAATREQARQEAPGNDLFSEVYAVLHTQPEGQLQGWDAHREVTLAAQPDVIVRSDAANTTPADPGTGRRAQSHPPRALRLLWRRRKHPRAAEVHRFVERYWRKMLCSRSWGRPPPYLGRLQSTQGAGPVAPTTTAVALPGAAGSRSAVNPRPKSVVQEICTLRSVGGGGRRLPPPTRWVPSNGHPYRNPANVRRRMKISALFYAELSAIMFLFTGSAYGWEKTALDRYVAAPDAT